MCSTQYAYSWSNSYRDGKQIDEILERKKTPLLIIMPAVSLCCRHCHFSYHSFFYISIWSHSTFLLHLILSHRLAGTYTVNTCTTIINLLSNVCSILDFLLKLSTRLVYKGLTIPPGISYNSTYTL